MNNHILRSCWSCKEPIQVGLVFCSLCEVIQPLSELNPFLIFSLPQTFDIDVSLIENKYLSIQKDLHPDKFISKTSQEKDYATQHSANVNDAYLKLKSPIKRAELMFYVNGKKCPTDENQTVQDEEVLMNILLKRENLQNATTIKEINHIIYSSKAESSKYIEIISQAFSSNDFVYAGKVLVNLSYLINFEDQAREKLYKMDNL